MVHLGRKCLLHSLVTETERDLVDFVSIIMLLVPQQTTRAERTELTAQVKKRDVDDLRHFERDCR